VRKRPFRSGPFPPAEIYSGLGFQQARALAGKGADVIIASRSSANAAEAIAVIKAEHPNAKIRFEQFDLADRASVTAFCDRLKSQVDRIDVLIANGGTAGTSDRRLNGAGMELVWATNVVGHYSLTAQLLALLKKGSNPCFVIMGSGARRTTGFGDMQTEKDYTWWRSLNFWEPAFRTCAVFQAAIEPAISRQIEMACVRSWRWSAAVKCFR
jgi:NAD(P)-dependent dehydrogenase (short-subunit alcohol dehydrogenase family)